MKKVATVFMAGLIAAACNFSKGIKKDLNTGLTTTNNGLSLEDIQLTDANNKAIKSNKITLGTQLQLIATGVENFTIEKGKVFPGCTIVVTDKKGNSVINVADAYADLKDGASEEDAKYLTATVNTGKPMVAGEVYEVKVKFFDKKDKGKEINSSLDIIME